MKPGRIQVYTGDGKGKTTAALGLAFRAVGQGLRVSVIQFLKGRETGELRAAPRLAPALTIQSFGRPGLVNLKAPSPLDRELVDRGWDLARRVIASGEFALVILDEFNLVLDAGLVPLTEALACLAGRPAGVELVLTGRRAPAALVALADLVTEMHPLKHYLKTGLRARPGIEW